MKWIDYREKLGIGFSDKKKAKLLGNIIATFLDQGALNEAYSNNDYYRFCLMTGIPYDSSNYGTAALAHLFAKVEMTVNQIISYYVAFVNSQTETDCEHKQTLIDVLVNEFLNNLSLPCDVISDEDGFFIFPKGAKELDDPLVSQPLQWLTEYPKTHTAFVKALKEYAEATSENASDVADKLRKTLETFMKEFFNITKALENCRPIYGAYLKAQGVPAEISGNFETLLQAYNNFMNGYAKHQDRTSVNVLEYLLYQTGNIIRLLITLRKNESIDQT